MVTNNGVIYFDVLGDHSYAKPETEKVKTRTVGIQTNLQFDDLRTYSDDCLKDVRVLKRKLVTDDIFKNDQTCKFYTGTVEQ